MPYLEGSLQDMLAVDKERAINFFFSGLRNVTVSASTDEMIYVASILAHYAMTPRGCVNHSSIGASLADIKEVVEKSKYVDLQNPSSLEINGSRLLLFAGFLRDEQERGFGYSLDWCDEKGQFFYGRASRLVPWKERSALLSNMSQFFPEWAMACRDLHRQLKRDSLEPFLVRAC